MSLSVLVLAMHQLGPGQVSQVEGERIDSSALGWSALMGWPLVACGRQLLLPPIERRMEPAILPPPYKKKM